MTGCRLCSEFRGSSTLARQEWNTPLFESPNFVALPSLGALVEGWLLLIPKQHFIAMGALPESLRSEMTAMKHLLCSALQDCYGTGCAFEHGPGASLRDVGCGVDHAHLHLVPAAFDLYSEVTNFVPADTSWRCGGLDGCRDAYQKGEDYLYLEQPLGSGRIATRDRLGSQVFRRAIATRIGLPDQFNWREHAQLPNVTATAQRIRDWSSRKGLGTNVCDLAA